MSCTVSSAALPAPSPALAPAEVVDHDLGAVPGQLHGVAAADAVARAGDDRDLAVEQPHGSPSCRSSYLCCLTGRQAADCIFRLVSTPTGPLPETVPGVVHRGAALWPDDEAVVDRDTRLTFTELDAAVREAAKAFVATGLQPGDRASVWAPNMHQWIVAALGLYSAGGVLVPLNTRFKGTEAAHVLRTSGARFLFTVTDFLDTDYVRAARRRRRARPGRGDRDPRGLGARRGTGRSWADFLARGADGRRRRQSRRARRRSTGDTMCDIIFTSGTTGAPKGAMLRHGASVRAVRRRGPTSSGCATATATSSSTRCSTPRG